MRKGKGGEEMTFDHSVRGTNGILGFGNFQGHGICLTRKLLEERGREDAADVGETS